MTKCYCDKCGKEIELNASDKSNSDVCLCDECKNDFMKHGHFRPDCDQ